MIQSSTSFSKLGLKSRFHQLELSLAPQSIATFQIKREKKVTKDLILGYIPPGGTTACSP